MRVDEALYSSWHHWYFLKEGRSKKAESRRFPTLESGGFNKVATHLFVSINK